MKVKQTKITSMSAYDLGIGGLLNGFGGMLYGGENSKENRLVGRYGKDNDNLIIDTCYTSDTGLYETGIIDHRYINGEHWLIVDEYETKKEAQLGHKKWTKVLKSEKLPNPIREIHLDEDIYLKKNGN